MAAVHEISERGKLRVAASSIFLPGFWLLIDLFFSLRQLRTSCGMKIEATNRQHIISEFPQKSSLFL
jgi:hypothetical protein